METHRHGEHRAAGIADDEKSRCPRAMIARFGAFFFVDSRDFNEMGLKDASRLMAAIVVR